MGSAGEDYLNARCLHPALCSVKSWKAQACTESGGGERGTIMGTKHRCVTGGEAGSGFYYT